MKSLSSLKKWSAGIIVITLVIAAVYINHVLSEVSHMLGGNTEEVDFSQFKSISGPIAITNISVLLEGSQTMKPEQTVMINNNKIISIGSNLAVPKEYAVIDGTDKFLIPGLIDSHVHIKKSKNDLLLYIANGITQIGEMTGMSHHFEYHDDVQKGMVGPDIFIASPKVASQKGLMPTLRSWFEKRHQNYHTPDEGRDAVRKYQSKGYQAIKMSSDLTKDIYFAINEEAKQLGIPVIGHMPNGITFEEFFRSGQSQLAHLTSVTNATLLDFGQISIKNPEAYIKYIKQNADSIAQRLKDRDITISSTLWLYNQKLEKDYNRSALLKKVNLVYQNPGWVEGSMFDRGWLPQKSVNNHNSDDHQKNQEIYWQAYLEATYILTTTLVSHGVSVIAGTDAQGAIGVIPGFSLHDELLALAELGISNAEVLHSAMVLPAQWMGVNTGQITQGYQADLVVLDKNPLIDINHTRTINAVISNGRYFDRPQLDAMLAAVKKANNDSRKINIDAYLKN